MGAKLKLTLKGFDILLDHITEAGGSIEAATERALESSAKLLTNEIKKGAVQRNLPTDSLITPKVNWSGNRASVEVGFELGEYNSNNPSSGYFALFREYGAPSKGGNRKTKQGYNRGAIEADPFIRPALQQNKKRVKDAQKQALERTLRGLSK